MAEPYTQERNHVFMRRIVENCLSQAVVLTETVIPIYSKYILKDRKYFAVI